MELVMSNAIFVRNLPVLLLLALMSSGAFAQPLKLAEAQLNGSIQPSPCNNSTNNGKTICEGAWSDPNGNSGGGVAVAVAGYGTLRVNVFSFLLANTADEETIWSTAVGSVISNDDLSLIGLTGPAYVKVEGSLLFKPNGTDNLGTAEYDISAQPAAGATSACSITNTTPSTCTFTVAVNPEEGIYLQRVVAAYALSSLTDFPAGANLYTSIVLGCTQDGAPAEGGAELKVSVRDAEGHIIKGVTVVGASGHKYN
jgi:hypothetical protein